MAHRVRASKHLDAILGVLHRLLQSGLLKRGVHFLRVVAGYPGLVLNELVDDLWSVIERKILIDKVVLQVFRLASAELHRSISAIADALSPFPRPSICLTHVSL